MTSFNQFYSGSYALPFWVAPPASETSPGAAGSIARDSSYFYVANVTNVWLRFLQTGWASTSPPANTVPPALSGTPSSGNTISSNNGTWSGAPTSYAYAWYEDGVLNPSLGTASTLLLTSGLIGHHIKCQVTATNAYGSAAAFSNEVTVTGGGYTPSVDFTDSRNSMYVGAIV